MIARRWIAGSLVLAVLAAASFGVSAAIATRRAAGAVTPASCRCEALLMRFLEMTPDQQQQAAPICERYCEQQTAARQDMEDARARLMGVLRQPRPEREDIDGALKNVGQVQARLQRGAAEYLLSLKSVLTEEQQNRLFDTVGERFCQQGACAGMGRGQGRGGGPGWMRHQR